MKYLKLFITYAVIGFFFETIMMCIINQPFNSGVFFGPYTFIYGFGGLIIYKINEFLNKCKLNKKQKKICYIFIMFSTLTFLEYILGFSIYYFNHIMYWDYINLPFSIGHFVCLPITITWVAMAYIFNFYLNKYILKFINKSNNELFISISILIIIDVVFNVCRWWL